MATKQAQNAPNKTKTAEETNQEKERGPEIIVRDNKRYIRTQKGTELPLLQLKGKDYLQVAHRLVWFREEHPDWQIITKPLEINVDKKYAIFRSAIVNDDGKTLATATKAESVSGFGDYVEKAETGATGRAVALCGFGTQFAPEFDEVNEKETSDRQPSNNTHSLPESARLADSPVTPTKRNSPQESVTTSFTPHFVRESESKHENCRNCGSQHLSIGMTKPDNPRNPNRPYWRCLDCPPEKSFSHWVKDRSIHPEAVKVAAQNRQADVPPLFDDNEMAAQ